MFALQTKNCVKDFSISVENADIVEDMKNVQRKLQKYGGRIKLAVIRQRNLCISLRLVAAKDLTFGFGGVAFDHALPMKDNTVGEICAVR